MNFNHYFEEEIISQILVDDESPHVSSTFLSPFNEEYNNDEIS